MKGLGYLLLCAGFIGAAYSTALDVDKVNWPLFLITAIAAVAGVEVAARREPTGPSRRALQARRESQGTIRHRARCQSGGIATID